jgi:hypothetical protein
MQLTEHLESHYARRGPLSRDLDVHFLWYHLWIPLLQLAVSGIWEEPLKINSPDYTLVLVLNR